MSGLSIVRQLVGASGPELAHAIGSLTEEELGRLAEQVSSTDWFEPPLRSRNELWPLVSSRMSTFTTGGSNPGFVNAGGPAGLNLWASLDPRFAASGRFPNGVMRALLYSHGLVIEDPVAMAADMYLTTSTDARHLARMAIESAVASVVEIEALLDAGVVLTFKTGRNEVAPIESRLRASVVENPDVGLGEDAIWNEFEASFVAGLDPRLQEVWSRVRHGDRHPPLDPIRDVAADGETEMVRLFIDVLANLRPRGVVDNALDVAAHAIYEASRLGNSLDLLCPTPLFARLVVAGVSDEHDLRLHELARTDVPSLDGLLVEDAVAIRLRSDSFERWRRDLSTALDRAGSLRDRLGPTADTSEVVRESIASAREQVLAESGKRSSRAAGGLVSLAAGILGGAVAGAAGGPVGAAIGATGAAIPLGVDAVRERWQAPKSFLRRHYLVFEPRRAQ